jgi:glycosyltransferase involved in cell wall biosynthesis
LSVETIGVVVGTYGDEKKWGDLAMRALASVEANTQLPTKTLWSHEESLHYARNYGAMKLDTDWLIFLDADDELDEGYIEAMAQAAGDIRKPSTIGVYADGTTDCHPTMIPARDLRTANHIVIGAMCSSSLFWKVGGFRDWPVLEDWCLWRRMVKAGGTVVEVPEAIYRVHVMDGSRNKDKALHDMIYHKIKRMS